ncbi:hypothetical protein MCOR27_005347 [Pyricularia oryzae]|uniref:Uncharacterized protein n=2 Tax=Pyricularia TaxID=48558 RepID=A0ABQ8N4V4_PYRGI|nr:hypothetical protein MCOR01_008990 [Pyricularia oryzae]KAI6291284.1 hypothetical protein MCOR33_010721 [Pyricularia grisea]KAI6279049.1 hypothetical protein MCOR27_005347 [Pyricularia oryzae]KAI6281773.1 hypothetical protein MCOR26_003113 [Pyricularia oryzae]KAI6328661.1 hypothetical protein MCOR30_005922 [Pyricularia oryzae]
MFVKPLRWSWEKALYSTASLFNPPVSHKKAMFLVTPRLEEKPSGDCAQKKPMRQKPSSAQQAAPKSLEPPPDVWTG